MGVVTDVTINKLRQYEDAAWFKDVAKLKIDRLGALRGQAHPLYQPVLDKYIDAVTWLYRGSESRFRRSPEPRRSGTHSGAEAVTRNRRVHGSSRTYLRA